MPDYEEAIREVFDEENRVLTRPEVFSLICAKYPGRGWVRATTYSYLGGLTVNDHARCHRPSVSERAFLFNLGRGRRRLYDPERDGLWICTDNGVQYVNEKAMIAHVEEAEPGLKLIGREGPTDQEPRREVVTEPDLLAFDRDGNYVVIGVEAGLATLKTLQRVLTQIRQVNRQLAADTPARGIIVAYQFDDPVQYAANSFPNVRFAQYDNERGFSYRWDK